MVEAFTRLVEAVLLLRRSSLKALTDSSQSLLLFPK
jgi:hypothetical protein